MPFEQDLPACYVWLGLLRIRWNGFRGYPDVEGRYGRAERTSRCSTRSCYTSDGFTDHVNTRISGFVY